MSEEHIEGSTFREVAIRLEGKIDALSAKLDGRLDAIMAKIDAGDRESLQLFKLQENELGHLATIVAGNSTRIVAVQSEAERRANDLERQITDIRSEFADFTTVRKIVFGLVALILVAFISGLLALVFIAP